MGTEGRSGIWMMPIDDWDEIFFWWRWDEKLWKYFFASRILRFMCRLWLFPVGDIHEWKLFDEWEWNWRMYVKWINIFVRDIFFYGILNGLVILWIYEFVEEVFGRVLLEDVWKCGKSFGIFKSIKSCSRTIKQSTNLS